MTHTPVLLKEVIEVLDIHEGDVYLDATVGHGGHAEEVFKRLGKRVEIVGIDADSEAVGIARLRLEMLGAEPKLATLNFRNLEKVNQILETESPNKILFDLGWNREQFDPGEGGVGKGFSFQKDEPLLMTFGDTTSSTFNASDIVNSWDEENIETILEAYGEERFAKRIAEAIIKSREEKTITTSGQLREIVKKATPIWYHFKKIHPATRTFQALRIAVNDELQALKEGLEKAVEILKNEGRIAVISFHSLEDRIVKNFFREIEKKNKGAIITKKPITASEEEISNNPRARSAKLRALKKKV